MSTQIGYVYLAINPSLPGQIKIGATTLDPQTRLNQLSGSTSIPTPFILAYSRHVALPFGVETELHDEFARHRVSFSREFFKIDLDEVVEALEKYKEVPVYYSPIIQTPFAELFASFPDDYSERELTANERAQCRVLEATQ